MKKKIIIGLSVAAALAVVVGFVLFLMGPTEDEKSVIKALNVHENVTSKNGHVEKVTFGERNEDAVIRFDAEVLGPDGKKIGGIGGRRIEGFGTIVGRFREGDAPPEPMPNRQNRGNRGPRNKERDKTIRAKMLSESDWDHDGQVTYEEATQKNMLMQRPSFDRLDVNHDGVITSADDQ
jgi:hypothetical protein